MRVIVVGLGVQGHKRRAIAGKECIGSVDPLNAQADYSHLTDVPLNSFDGALVCTPDAAKFEILTYLLANRKHVLVEKPLLTHQPEELEGIARLAADHRVACYTAYNHRFEPHFMRMRDMICQGDLGRLYTLRLFYGNGTARLVRDSNWRDQEGGVLTDLGSHLLDTLLYWIGQPDGQFHIRSANCFENRALDHCSFGVDGPISIHLEMTLLSWRNHFYADLLAEKGSAHIRSLCKWGPSSYCQRDRKLPSGRPDETTTTLVQPDPTWALEYDHFKRLCELGQSNIQNDIWINAVLNQLTRQVRERSGP